LTIDDDRRCWHDALFLAYIALAMFGIGGVVAFVVTIVR